MEEHRGYDEIAHAHVVETLINMFGDVLCKDAISTIVESCDGDLNTSVEAVMNITSDSRESIITADVESSNTTILSGQTSGTSNLSQQGLSTSGLTLNHQEFPTFSSSQQEVSTYNLSQQQSPICSSSQQEVDTFSLNQLSNQQPNMSYAEAWRSTGAIPKTTQCPAPELTINRYNWTAQQRRIIKYHNNGSRVMVIMRGVPGSGKTYLAKRLIDIIIGGTPNDFKTHVFSSDDYFSLNGMYLYDKFRIGEAHAFNQNRVLIATKEGVSPIIVDNTNTQLWEMETYVKVGAQNGYYIEVMIPNTQWARNVNQLSKRNSHNVPPEKIRDMLKRFESPDVTVTQLMGYCKAFYPPGMLPPVMRNVPPVESKSNIPPVDSKSNIPPVESKSNVPPVESKSNVPPVESKSNVPPVESKSNVPPVQSNRKSVSIMSAKSEDVNSLSTTNDKSGMNTEYINRDKQIISSSFRFPDNNTDNITSSPITVPSNDEETAELVEEKIAKILEIQKQFEEIEKVQRQWDNGESWDTDIQDTANNKIKDASVEPKPPRKNDSDDSLTTPASLMTSVSTCQDWRQISMFMPSWHEESALPIQKPPEIPVEKISCGTSINRGDTDVINNMNLKVIVATPRDINYLHTPTIKEKIPQKRMLDKSSMTNEEIDTYVNGPYVCEKAEKHFLAFRRLFKDVAQANLRDIFDNCCGDVNWAVQIVLDGRENNKLEIIDNEELSDNDDDVAENEQCNCLAAYSIVPDMHHVTPAKTTSKQHNSGNSLDLQNVERKVKKLKTLPESSIQLKQQIEKNVAIADNYYSEHCLKIRKMRRGEYDVGQFSQHNHIPTQTLDVAQSLPQENSSSVSDLFGSENANGSEDETESIEDTVNITLGTDFLFQLDQKFGRKDMVYPDNISTNISMPMSLLKEINALWMESFMDQLDDQSKQAELMMKQDEDFARQLAQKEEELFLAGKQQDSVPDFKEIMDMDLAVALYQKDIAEWRNNEPNDLAAKLTRDKLYNLFPECPKDVLSELLMAHNNNFLQTVEALLVSTGNAEILENENGVNKFVMQKEIEQREKLKAEENKPLSETDWPLWGKGQKSDDIDAETYRTQANVFLELRNLNYQKAQDCIRRGMTQVATHYKEMAEYYTRKYELNNCYATIAQMQVNSANCDDTLTIDMHYCRVAEANTCLDIFLDTHISKMREDQNNRVGPKYVTLFVITGRGVHSPAGPRLKPAIKNRLRQRFLKYKERNPGLLASKICAEDKLTHELL